MNKPVKRGGAELPPGEARGSTPVDADCTAIALVTLGNAAQVGRRVAVEQIESEILRQAHAVWLERCGERRFPARCDIAPRDIAAFLRNVMLYRVIESGNDFEYRIMGDSAVVAWGRSFRGMGRTDLNALQSGMGDVVARVCRWVVRKQEPLVMRGLLRKGAMDSRRQETIFLPLGDEGGAVDYILSVGIYVPQSFDQLNVTVAGPADDDAP